MEPGGTTVADLVEAAVARAPDALAVVAGATSLSYAELDARANRLGHHLQSIGVGPDVAVGVCLERSVDLAVALLAVLKAGGACVPLDPAYPRERLAFMAGDAAVAAVLTSAALADRVSSTGAPVVRVDADTATWAGLPATAPLRAAGTGNVGYVIYTSGSTGRPKGVMLTHRGLVNHHRATADLYRLGPGDRVLQFCSVGFDASIEEMFPTWASGAAVVYRPDDAPLLGRGWLDWLSRQRITVMNLPTAYWQAWTGDLDASGQTVPDDLRLMVVGGEKALRPTYRTWARVCGRPVRWINAYGPTETTCMSTFFEAAAGDPGDAGDPPIGRPLPDTTLLVVDEGLQPVPAGGTGELLIGGAGLARGYLNLVALTAERFVEIPAGGTGGTRMYRTGDLVRQRPDGDLDFVGRIDDQVKVHGFRVECGEVEAALGGHPFVGAAAVVAREDTPGEKRLVAYVVGTGGGDIGGDIGAAALRRFLADRLPAHMIPGAFTVLDALPLTPNGKVDRAGLPAPGSAAINRLPGPSRSPVEDRMAAIWARVLALDVADLRPGDDFFALGGHSLLATQVIAQVREEFGTETPLRAIFEAPTLAGLAAMVGVSADERAGGPPLAGGAPPHGAPVPLSFAQEQMWALERAATPAGLYNLTALHTFDRPVDEHALGEALAIVVERHDMLRTGFAVECDPVQQVVGPAVPVGFASVDLGGTPAAARDAELRRRIAEQDSAPFDLARPPLFRVGLFQLGDGRARLAVTFDHLICDGTGASIFVGELLEAYEATRAHRAPSLPALPVQFADFAVWQRTHVTDEVLRRQVAWWAEALGGMPLGPAVPFDLFPVAPTRRIASKAIAVRPGVRRRLEAVARATGSTVFTVGAAAVLAVFGRWGGSTDVVVSTTLSGRSRAELEGLIGMFSGIGRIRLDLSGDPSFTETVTRCRDRVVGMFENQDVPFMRVRRVLLPDFPSGGLELAAALPVEFQYFRTATGDDQEFHFRGQLHPLSLTLSDDGEGITGELAYKLDFYEPATIDLLAGDLERTLDAVGADPALRFSELPVTAPPRR